MATIVNGAKTVSKGLTTISQRTPMVCKEDPSHHRPTCKCDICTEWTRLYSVYAHYSHDGVPRTSHEKTYRCKTMNQCFRNRRIKRGWDPALPNYGVDLFRYPGALTFLVSSYWSQSRGLDNMKLEGRQTSQDHLRGGRSLKMDHNPITDEMEIRELWSPDRTADGSVSIGDLKSHIISPLINTEAGTETSLYILIWACERSGKVKSLIDF